MSRTIERAMVVGASSGLGRAVAEQLLAAGARHVVATTHTGNTTELARAFGETPRLYPLHLDLGGPQRALEDVSYAWGQPSGGYDAVLVAGGSIAATPGRQAEQAIGTRWVLSEAANKWVRDGGVLGVVTSTLTEGRLPEALVPLRHWVAGKRAVAERAAHLGRYSPGITVLDFAFTRIRGTRQWEGAAPEVLAELAELERREGMVLDVAAAAAYVCHYLRGRGVSGRLVPGQRPT